MSRSEQKREDGSEDGEDATKDRNYREDDRRLFATWTTLYDEHVSADSANELCDLNQKSWLDSDSGRQDSFPPSELPSRADVGAAVLGAGAHLYTEALPLVEEASNRLEQFEKIQDLRQGPFVGQQWGLFASNVEIVVADGNSRQCCNGEDERTTDSAERVDEPEQILRGAGMSRKDHGSGASDCSASKVAIGRSATLTSRTSISSCVPSNFSGAYICHDPKCLKKNIKYAHQGELT
ncbi:hypothetical protein M433DRAFT_817 [Acidomyces richmondensis BFW]|nr:hypothetical protein M433DRAFT_817 [Acidomyces richmondensis BFW]